MNTQENQAFSLFFNLFLDLRCSELKDEKLSQRVQLHNLFKLICVCSYSEDWFHSYPSPPTSIPIAPSRCLVSQIWELGNTIWGEGVVLSSIVELLSSADGSLLCLCSSGMSHSVSTRKIGLLSQGQQ